MNISDEGLQLITEAESVQLCAYPDPASALHRACLAAGINPLNHGYRALAGWESLGGEPWTIGVGHTGGVKPGDTCTEEQAMNWLRADVAWAEAAVRNNVGVKLSQGQFDALVSLVFNIGAGQFGSSTLLRRLNDTPPDYAGAAAEFPRWIHAGSKVLPGLVKRRALERAMFEGAAT